MSWFVVGGIAVGATAGAIVGSKKGGDDVWKDALIGGAIGGTAGYGAGALGAAEAAAPAAVAGEGGAGIMGVEGAGAALAPAAAESLAFTGPSVGSVVAPEAAGGFGASSGMGLGQAGGFGTPGAFAGSSSPFGTAGGANVVEGGGLMNAGFAPGMQAPIQMVEAPAATEYAMWGGDEATNVAANTPKTPTPPPTKSPLEKGFGSAMSWLSEPKNAMLTGVLGLGALSMFNNNNEDNFGGSTVTPAGYPLSPNFKPSRYQPTRTYAQGGEAYGDYDGVEDEHASGGLAQFAKGGDTSDKAFAAAQRYQAMIDPRMRTSQEKAPSWVGRSIANVNDPGIYIDRDDDTAYQDALTAAQTRMGKVAKGANVQLSAMQKPTPLGKLNLGPVAGREEEERKATGGITGLGGYAHGGNPRLLRGPGDGMSDDIPATIADKQPARLADGEFVVPADVVSGLGNGSTEAGAKKLHQMMDKVRVDRTGTKKQGKQINADKYIPGAKADKKAFGGIASYADGGGISYGPEFVRNMSWGPYFVNDEYGNPVPIHQAVQGIVNNQQAAPSSTANTKPQGYDPDYYNPQFYENQLKDLKQAQQDLASVKALPGFNADWYLQQNPDIAADKYWSSRPYEHYMQHGIQEGRAPFEGGVPGGQLPSDALTAEYAQRVEALSGAQSNLDRLAASGIKYDPYTIANRPSSAEPQFYGNIYKPEYTNYASPNYALDAGLNSWSNVAQPAPKAEPQQEKPKPAEEKKRSGGITSIKRRA